MILFTVPHSGKCLPRKTAKRNCDKVAEEVALGLAQHLRTSYLLLVNKDQERTQGCAECDLNRDPSQKVTAFRRTLTTLLNQTPIKLLVDVHSFYSEAFGRCSLSPDVTLRRPSQDFGVTGECQIVVLYESKKMVPLAMQIVRIARMVLEPDYGPASVAVLEGKQNSITEEALSKGLPALLIEFREEYFASHLSPSQEQRKLSLLRSLASLFDEYKDQNKE